MELQWYNYNFAAGDKLAKVRPFYEMMNERFLKSFQKEKNLRVDEATIQYFGKHSSKQYIKVKPIKFGYMLWCLNSCLDYLVKCEPYPGKRQTLPALALGGSVATKLMKPLPQNLSFQATFDNLFHSSNL